MSEASYLYGQEDFTLVQSSQCHYRDTSKPKLNGLYQCTKCEIFKPKSDFYADKRVPCGIRNRCKICYHKKGEKK